MNKAITCTLLVAALSGCANYRPIVDMQNVTPAVYETDLKDCQGYASQVNAGGEAAAGVAAGALLGALLGAAIGGHRNVGYGAGIGAVQGGATGTAYGAGGQMQVVKNCMSGRGYKVLR